MRIILLLEMVHGAADQPMRIQLTAKHLQFAASAVAQNGLCNAKRAAKTGDDAADGRDLYLRGRVPDQIDLAIADAALHWDPAAIDRNLGALPFQRLHMFLFEKTREALGGVVSFADDAQRGA